MSKITFPVPPEKGNSGMNVTDVNNRAAEFAEVFGEFSLHFDATQNSTSPDYRPWTLTLGTDETGWGALTAEEAIDFAARELAE